MDTVIGLVILGVMYWIGKVLERRKNRPKPPSDPFDEELFHWSKNDLFTFRDLVRSVMVMGAAGSGKSSSVGYLAAKALVRNEMIGLLILASKPEDRAFWKAICDMFGREMIVFGPGEPHRFNVIDYEAKHGDSRNLTECILTISESLERHNGDSSDPFWKTQHRRVIQSAIDVIKLAYGTVSVWDIQRFVNDAAQSAEQLADEGWRNEYHNNTMRAAFRTEKTAIEEHDFQLARDFWLREWPGMSDRTRTSIIAGVMGICHAYNTGIVRELIGTGTSITPETIENGAVVLVDMPVANYGAAGLIVAGALKYCMQRAILRRHAQVDSRVVCIWIDEYQNHLSSFDAKYLAECRSHLGCMFVLTQSIHSFYSSMRGDSSESQTKALLTNIAHKVFMTLGDDESARFASSHIGRAPILLGTSSRSNGDRLLEDMMGKGNISSGMGEHMDDLIEARLFMNGLKTGGPEHDFIAEGWVVRNGAPFSNGENALLVSFSQK